MQTIGHGSVLPPSAAHVHRSSRRRSLAILVALAAAACLGTTAPAHAALVVSPTPLTLELASGDVGVVRGDITNTTGFDLLSSDFFGSFTWPGADAPISLTCGEARRDPSPSRGSFVPPAGPGRSCDA